MDGWTNGGCNQTYYLPASWSIKIPLYKQEFWPKLSFWPEFETQIYEGLGREVRIHDLGPSNRIWTQNLKTTSWTLFEIILPGSLQCTLHVDIRNWPQCVTWKLLRYGFPREIVEISDEQPEACDIPPSWCSRYRRFYFIMGQTWNMWVYIINESISSTIARNQGFSIFLDGINHKIVNIHSRKMYYISI